MSVPFPVFVFNVLLCTTCFQKEKLTAVGYQLCTNIMHYSIM